MGLEVIALRLEVLKRYRGTSKKITEVALWASPSSYIPPIGPMYPLLGDLVHPIPDTRRVLVGAFPGFWLLRGSM